jgi:hypothetical protein
LIKGIILQKRRSDDQAFSWERAGVVVVEKVIWDWIDTREFGNLGQAGAGMCSEEEEEKEEQGSVSSGLLLGERSPFLYIRKRA